MEHWLHNKLCSSILPVSSSILFDLTDEAGITIPVLQMRKQLTNLLAQCHKQEMVNLGFELGSGSR